MPLVSIIVPVYKAERWLHRCVDSILAQTMTDFELLLIDDGSPDKSGEICDEYASKDDRIKVIHQENKGSVGARNAGLATAKGEYLAFVDSDDYVREDMLRKMVDVAERDNLDIVWCGVEGELMDKSVFSLFEVKDDFDFMIKQLFNGKIQGWLWNKLIKRDFWRQCDIKVDEKYSVLEDVLISLQLFYNNPKQVVVEEYFYVYNRTNENSYTVGAGMFVKSIGNINLIHKFLVDKNLLELYKILSKDSLNKETTLDGDFYRSDKVFVGQHEGCPADKIEEAMNSFFEYVNSEINKRNFFLPFIAHYYILYIHPYYDFNGRTARMVSLWISLLSNIHMLLPTYISEAINDDKNNYYKALDNSRFSHNDITYFLTYLIELANRYYLVYKNINIIKEELATIGESLSSTESYYLKRIIINSKKGWFNYRGFIDFCKLDITKQGALKILNKLLMYIYKHIFT